jgi:hypothetical protein
MTRTPPFRHCRRNRCRRKDSGFKGFYDKVVRPHVAQASCLVPRDPLVLQAAKIAQATDCKLDQSGQIAFDKSRMPSGDLDLPAER